MQEVDESFNGREIDVPTGEILEVSLPENRTTGFRWTLELRGEPACYLVREFARSGDGSPGGGGRHHWQFQAEQAGSGLIELFYRRPWDQQAMPARIFSLRVRVKP